MSRSIAALAVVLLTSLLPASGRAQARTLHPLTLVYANDNFQLTGLSVSKHGRLFVNFPRWSDRYVDAVVEVMPGGTARPFPNREWNRWNLKPATAATHFVCVQSVVVDGSDALWVLDAAAPLLASTVPGGPKLVRIDLATNRVTRTIAFPPSVAKADTYLNDVRFDLKRDAAYITDSGHGGLIIVNLETGTAHRALDGHPSVLVEPGVQVVVEGKPLLQNGKPPQFQADGIALSPDGRYLFYKAVTAKTLYRVPTALLRKADAAASDVASAVEKVATTFPTDGLWADAKQRLYLSDVERDAVVRRSADGTMARIVQDRRLQWPDTFTQGPDGTMYVSKSTRTLPYAVFKFAP